MSIRSCLFALMLALVGCGGSSESDQEQPSVAEQARASCVAFVDDYCDAIVNVCGLADSVVQCENELRAGALDCDCVVLLGDNVDACNADLPDVTCADLDAGLFPSTCDGVFLVAEEC